MANRFNKTNSTEWDDTKGTAQAVLHGDLNDTIGDTTPPIGTVIGWLADFTGTPASLPDGWVLCDGSVLSDANSPLNGQTIPDINGDEQFIRGVSGATGGTGGSETHTHTHGTSSPKGNGGGSLDRFSTGGTKTTTSGNHVPEHYDVVYIMRVK